LRKESYSTTSTFSGFLDLVEEALTQLCMIYATIPRFIDHIHKSWHLDPKVLEADEFWLLRVTIICKKKWAMIGQGRGERMKDVVRECLVLVFIAKEGVELAKE
jgi:hypothetical protein